MRIVVDTNVLVSAFLNKHSLPRKILNLQQTGRYQMVVSEEIMHEYQRVLTEPDLLMHHHLSTDRIVRYLTLLKQANIVVTPTMHVSVVKDDPDDDKFLSCALAGNAEYLISGDHHLLDLQAYKGTQILTPFAFLTGIGQAKKAA
jgi:putative PIN family toxin of toxin-antitoxin system